MRSLIVTVAIVAIVVASHGASRVASGHEKSAQYSHSVVVTADGRRLIRWCNESKYGEAVRWARDAWNELATRPRNPELVKNCTNPSVTVVSLADDRAYLGWYKYERKEIWLNSTQLDRAVYGLAEEKAVVTHEFGHALNFRDVYPEDGSHWKNETLMWFQPTETPFKEPARHDVNDYHNRWD